MISPKSLHIPTPLNYDIRITEFLSVNAKGIVVFLAATGVTQAYYLNISKFLQKNNYTVYTFDYGGIGKSKNKPLTKFDTSLSNWANNDAESVIRYINKLHPNKKINCIAHSLGGQLLGLIPSNKTIHNVILVASPNNHYSFWTGISKIKTFITWFIIFPFFANLLKYFPCKNFSKMENLPKNVSKEFYKWSQQKEFYFSKKINILKYHHQITKKLTSYSTTNDKFATKKSVDWITSKYTHATIIRKHLLPQDYNTQKIGHFGFFNKRFESTIWQEFLKDLKD